MDCQQQQWCKGGGGAGTVQLWQWQQWYDSMDKAFNASIRKLQQ